jgi:magnesium chelatase accessory protein
VTSQGGTDAGDSVPPADWPNRASSRLVVAGGMRWHVQVMGSGPYYLLLHGTGAATHSWRDLAPLLARRFTVIAPDLPGHGFSSLPADRRLSIEAMSALVATLLRALEVAPRHAAGHSAGAAILARMCLEGRIAPAGIASLNGALLPLGGLPGRVFSPLAKVLARSSLTARLFAAVTGPAGIDNLLRDTGSRIDARGAELYLRLAKRPEHVGAALAMMANWDLDALSRDLAGLRTPLLCVTGSHDGTIPPRQAREVAARVAGARLVELPGLGHLAHEEAPRQVATLLMREARAATRPDDAPRGDASPRQGMRR